MNVSCKFLPKDADKNSIPILFEVNISNSKDAYSNNVDIEEFALYPQEKEVTFLPYSCFVIESVLLAEDSPIAIGNFEFRQL